MTCIGIIFGAGATAGSYYTETRITKEQNKLERELMNEWSSKEQYFSINNQCFKRENDDLKIQHLELKSEIYNSQIQSGNETKK